MAARWSRAISRGPPGSGSRLERDVQEADHAGFLGLERGGQALSMPGVRHDPGLHSDRRGGLEPAGGNGLVGDGPPAMTSTGRGGGADAIADARRGVALIGQPGAG